MHEKEMAGVAGGKCQTRLPAPLFHTMQFVRTGADSWKNHTPAPQLPQMVQFVKTGDAS